MVVEVIDQDGKIEAIEEVVHHQEDGKTEVLQVQVIDLDGKTEEKDQEYLIHRKDKSQLNNIHGYQSKSHYMMNE